MISLRLILILLCIGVLCSTPVVSEKSKGLFSGIILDVALNLQIADTPDNPQYLQEEQHETTVDPHNASAWQNIGNIELKNQDWRAARFAFEQAINEDKTLEKAWWGLFVSLDRLDQYDALHTAASDYSEIFPGRSIGFVYDGYALANLEQYSESMTLFQKALEINPELPIAGELYQKVLEVSGSVPTTGQEVFTPEYSGAEGIVSFAEPGNYSVTDTPLNLTIYPFIQSIPGLVAHYPLSGDAQDISGNDYHGKMVHAVPDVDRFHHPNGSLSFNGGDSYVELPGVADLKSPAFSIAVWVKIANFGPVWTEDQPQPVIYFSRNNNTEWIDGFQLSATYHGPDQQQSGGVFGAYLPSLEDVNAYTGTSHGIEPDTWYFVVVTADEKELSIYLDGSLMEKTDTGFDIAYDPFSPVFLGGTSGLWPGSNFDGTLDELRIYNRVLSYEEVHALYSEERDES